MYLPNDLSNDNVTNLIMIGTPNAGAQMAFTTNDCSPKIDDFKPNAPATNAQQKYAYSILYYCWCLFSMDR